MFNKKRIIVFVLFILLMFFMMMFAGSPTENAGVITRHVVFTDGYDGRNISEQDVEVGKDAKVPEDPYHRNFVFGGWYLYSDHDVRVRDFTNILNDLHVIALYQGDRNNNGIADDDDTYFTVSFVNSLNNSVIKSERVLIGMNASAPSAPSMDGYTFRGWDKDYTNVTSNLTVYTIYNRITNNDDEPKVNQYTVTFVDGLTNETISTQTVNEGASATEPEKPVHEKYVFVKWDGNFTNVRQNVTVTAVYKTDENGPTGGPDNIPDDEQTYTITINYLYEEDHDKVAHEKFYEERPYNNRNYNVNTPTDITPEKNVGHFTPDRESVSGTIADDHYLDKVEYVYFTRDSYTVTFKNYDGSVLKEEEVLFEGDATAPETPSKPATAEYSYVFSGWSEEFTNVQGDLTVTAEYEEKPNPYTVTLNKDENVSSVTGAGTYEFGKEVTITATLGSQDGYTYTFVNWTDEEGNEVSKDATYKFTMPAENVTYKANASKTANTNTPYVVEYKQKDLNAETYTTKETENKTGTTDTEVDLGTSYQTKYEGFEFEKVEYYNGEELTESKLINGNGNTKAVVYYTRKTYEVIVDPNCEGTGCVVPECEGEDCIKPEPYEYGDKVKPTPLNDRVYTLTYSENALVQNKLGTKTVTAEFLGFCIENTPNCEVVEIPEDGYEIKENTTFYAKWDESELTFNTTAGNGYTTAEYTYTFEGWKDGNETKPGVYEITLSADKTITAQYDDGTANPYTVTVNKNENISATTGAGTYNYNSSVTVTATLGNDGGYNYEFTGWVDAEGNVVSRDLSYTFTMPAKNVVLTANATKTAKDDTKYIIHYYQSDLKSDDTTEVTYTEVTADKEEKTYTTDEEVVLTNQDYAGKYTGFELNTDKSVMRGTVTYEPTLELHLYYDRNSYTVTLNKDENVSSVTGAGTYEFGKEVTISATLGSQDGYTYTFVNWTDEDGNEVSKDATYKFTMPAENVTYKANASKTANTNTPYVVEYKQKDLNAETYTTKETENKTGTTDTEVDLGTSYQTKYEGFEFEKVEYYNGEELTTSNLINGNGNTKAVVYYTRKTYEVIVDPNCEGDGCVVPECEGEDCIKPEPYEYGDKVKPTPLNDRVYTLTYSENELVQNKQGTKTVTAEFLGFCIENTPNCEVVEIPEDGYEIKEKTTFYAKWDESELTFNTTAGNGYTTAEYTYTFEGWKDGNETKPGVYEITLSKDKTITAQYDDGTANPYTVTLNKDENTASVSGAGTYEYGKEVTISATVGSQDGYTYTFVNWTDEEGNEVSKDATYKFIMPAENVTYTANTNKVANTDTPYVVEYHQKDVKASTYTVKDTDNKTGTTDQPVVLGNYENKYEGFTFEKIEYYNGEEVTTSNLINGNGNTVVKVYYTRNSYTLEVNNGENVASVTGAGTYEFGESVTIGATLENEEGYGYAFINWTDDNNNDSEVSKNNSYTFTMPAADTSYTAHATKTANTNTPYTVEFYYEENGSYDKDPVRVSRKGTTGTDVSVTAADKTPSEGYVLDDTNPDKVYTSPLAGNGTTVLKVYFKQIFTVTYAPGNKGTFREVTHENLLYNVDTPSAPSEEAMTHADGYHFTGWNPTVSDKVTATVTYTAQWAANENTQYKVNYYWQNIEDNNYTLHETTPLTGKTDQTVNAEIKTYEGFTHNPNAEGTLLSATVLGDGSLELNVYYDRNTKSVTYRYTNETVPTGAPAVPETKSYKYGATIPAATVPELAGYEFDGWNGEVTVMGTNDVNVTGTWDIIEYNITYNLDGGSVTQVNPTTYTVETETFTLNNPTKEGYTFTGWTGTEVDTQSTTVTVNKGSVGDREYTAHYTINKWTVTYEYEGTTPEGAPELPASHEYEYGATVEKAAVPTLSGYVFSGWTGEVTTMPDYNVTVTGSWRERNQDVSITTEKTVDIDTGAKLSYGDTITITITVKNNGTDPSDPVTLIDSLLAESPVTLVSTTTTPSSVTPSGSILDGTNGITIDSVGAGEEVVIVVKVKVEGENAVPGTEVKSQTSSTVNGETYTEPDVWSSTIESEVTFVEKTPNTTGYNIVVLLDESGSMGYETDSNGYIWNNTCEWWEDGPQCYKTSTKFANAKAASKTFINMIYPNANDNTNNSKLFFYTFGSDLHGKRNYYTYDLDMSYPVSNYTQAETLKNAIDTKLNVDVFGSGTPYADAFNTAYQKLNANSIKNNGNDPIVVFLTDGTSSNKYQNALNNLITLKAKVYSIGFDVTDDQFATLTTISTSTGGKAVRASNNLADLEDAFAFIKEDFVKPGNNEWTEKGVAEMASELLIDDSHPIQIFLNGSTTAEKSCTTDPTTNNNACTGYIIKKDGKYDVDASKFAAGSKIKVVYYVPTATRSTSNVKTNRSLLNRLDMTLSDAEFNIPEQKQIDLEENQNEVIDETTEVIDENQKEVTTEEVKENVTPEVTPETPVENETEVVTENKEEVTTEEVKETEKQLEENITETQTEEVVEETKEETTPEVKEEVIELPKEIIPIENKEVKEPKKEEVKEEVTQEVTSPETDTIEE